MTQPGKLSCDQPLDLSTESIQQIFASASSSDLVEIRNPHVESRVTEATKRSATPSSVLILITDEVQPRVLLTKRQAGIRFGGHLCFPGGRADPGENIIETAVRECHEEIGLLPGAANILGSFGHYYTQAGFRIDPVVATVAKDINYSPDPAEVASMHWVPLADTLDPSSYVLKSMFKDRGYFGFNTPEIHVGGPTASLMIGFLEWLSDRR